jgi:hypothetical protein
VTDFLFLERPFLIEREAMAELGLSIESPTDRAQWAQFCQRRSLRAHAIAGPGVRIVDRDRFYRAVRFALSVCSCTVTPCDAETEP